MEGILREEGLRVPREQPKTRSSRVSIRPGAQLTLFLIENKDHANIFHTIITVFFFTPIENIAHISASHLGNIVKIEPLE